jgi:hypothetical protein
MDESFDRPMADLDENDETPKAFRKLQPDFKEAWLSALRSGDYLQGMGALEDLVGLERRYCCLGVGCLVLGVEPADSKGNTKSADPDWPIHLVWQPPSTLCVDGQEANDPKWIQTELANMNDDGAHTFADIAKWIEQNL